MSYNLTITLSPEALALVKGAQAWPDRAVAALTTALDAENQLTIGHAAVRHLRGPRPKVLGRVSSRLVQSINAPPAVRSGGTILSTIGTNVRYAGIHEFGFVGTVQVKAFTRKVHTYAGGAKVVAHLTKSGRIVKKKSKITATGTAPVKAHARQVKMPERSFLRSSISERRADYSATLSAALLASLRTSP